MKNLHDFITEIEAHCRETGLSPATICGHATGNPRLFGRLKRRAEKIDEDIRKLRTYMAEHPVRAPLRGQRDV